MYNQYLSAVPYSKISANTPVLCAQALPHKISVQLPPVIVHNIRLYSISKIDSEPIEDIPFQGSIQQDSCHPWLEIVTDWLDTTAGHHIYRLYFADVFDSDFFELYISYIIQDNSPDKPYIYMKRDT